MADKSRERAGFRQSLTEGINDVTRIHSTSFSDIYFLPSWLHSQTLWGAMWPAADSTESHIQTQNTSYASVDYTGLLLLIGFEHGESMVPKGNWNSGIKRKGGKDEWLLGAKWHKATISIQGHCFYIKPRESMQMWEAGSPLLEAPCAHAKNTSKFPAVFSMVQKLVPF